MSRLIDIINGPNLNLLGEREPGIYGAGTLADVEAEAQNLCAEAGATLRMRQSNHEGQLIDWIQEARKDSAGIVINPGGYTHTSVAILDALNAFPGLVVELHVSAVHKREAFRHHSYVSKRSDAVIAGCGIGGYGLAVRHILTLTEGS